MAGSHNFLDQFQEACDLQGADRVITLKNVEIDFGSTPANSVNIDGGHVVIPSGGGLTLQSSGLGTDIALGTDVGTKIGTAAAQKLAFHDATPVVQAAVPTTPLTTITITDAAGTPDYALSALTTSSPYGLATLAEAVSLLYVIKNLQEIVAQIRTALINKGIMAAA